MVTARTQSADIVEALSLGANDYVTKPIDFPVALARIAHAPLAQMGGRRSARERRALRRRGPRGERRALGLESRDQRGLLVARWKALLGYEDTEIGTTPKSGCRAFTTRTSTASKTALDAHLATAPATTKANIASCIATARTAGCAAAARRSPTRTGRVDAAGGSLTDITEAKVADALTGLPNRLLFVDLLDRAIKRSERAATISSPCSCSASTASRSSTRASAS